AFAVDGGTGEIALDADNPVRPGPGGPARELVTTTQLATEQTTVGVERLVSCEYGAMAKLLLPTMAVESPPPAPLGARVASRPAVWRRRRRDHWRRLAGQICCLCWRSPNKQR